MKSGKLNWDDLKNIIEGNTGVIRPEVVVHSGVGEDCAVINFGEYDCVLSTDPITGAGENMGRLAVNINCNDVASSGVEPLGIMVTILAPEGTLVEEIKDLMREIGEESRRLGIEILGGHTEVTSAVNRMIVSCTVIGMGRKGKVVATGGARDGDDIIVTKYLALEGTSIIVNDMEDKVRDVLSTEELEEARGFVNMLSVVAEGRIAGEYGVNSMHDITEGGVLGALWEVAEASGTGFEVMYEKMPIRPAALKVCEHLNIDPLKFISSGSMLITAPKGEELVTLLKKAGINAAVIGKITEGRGIMIKDGIEMEIEPPQRDELFNI
ncbi:MAG: AIR synthase family protein [Bacillota bacterium]|nr:AIR synthase family protein [Bacillota bacterium]